MYTMYGWGFGLGLCVCVCVQDACHFSAAVMVKNVLIFFTIGERQTGVS